MFMCTSYGLLACSNVLHMLQPREALMMWSCLPFADRQEQCGATQAGSCA